MKELTFKQLQRNLNESFAVDTISDVIKSLRYWDSKNLSLRNKTFSFDDVQDILDQFADRLIEIRDHTGIQ